MLRGVRLLAVVLGLACDREPPAALPELDGEGGQEVDAPAPEPVPRPEPEPEPEPEPPYGLPELTNAERSAMYAGPADPIKPMRIHHIVGNESRHDLFFDHIRDRGGAYMGVAADANYSLIAVAKPKYAFLIDIDRAVLNTHLVYSVLLPEAETPDELLGYFAEESRDLVLQLLERDLPERERVRVKTTFKIARHALAEHLAEIRTQTVDGEPTTWMSNPDHYGYVRRMFVTDRIRIMPGNLGGDHAMATISAAVRELGTTITVVYESNAAEWFLFHKPYIDNMRALPIAPDAVLCRTIDTKPYRTRYGATFTPGDAKWNYNVHALADYRDGLGSEYQNRNAMLQAAERDGTLRRDTGIPGLSLIAID